MTDRPVSALSPSVCGTKKDRIGFVVQPCIPSLCECSIGTCECSAEECCNKLDQPNDLCQTASLRLVPSISDRTQA